MQSWYKTKCQELASRCALLTCSAEQVQQERPLVALLHPHHLLRDVLRGGADSAHCQEDVLLQEIPGQDLEKNKTMYYLESLGVISGHVIKRKHGAALPLFFFLTSINSLKIAQEGFEKGINRGRTCWRTKCTWISLGKVALNIMVCRMPLCGMVSCSTMRLIWGSKPMSNMRSASSRTR